MLCSFCFVRFCFVAQKYGGGKLVGQAAGMLGMGGQSSSGASNPPPPGGAYGPGPTHGGYGAPAGGAPPAASYGAPAPAPSGAPGT